tara:strand:+ start:194 stop:625 length:432 start_codon:yes stop_codon:yes gene_type:complete
MSKNRTNKSKYPSRYSPDGWVSAPQYITEFVCEKKAQKENKELPIKFWEISEWRKYFRYQITIANSLLKDFPEEAIIAALKDRRCWKTYSLRSPFLQSIIKEKEALIKDREATDYEIVEKESIKHKTNNNKKSIISKLRELDE